MSHDYLLVLYDTLDARIEEKYKLLNKYPVNSDEYFMLEGEIAMLKEFKNYLFESFHERLPRAVKRGL